MRKMDRRFESHTEQIKALAPCTDARTASHANAGPYVHARAHVLNYLATVLATPSTHAAAPAPNKPINKAI
jgi:hypothetical protein